MKDCMKLNCCNYRILPNKIVKSGYTAAILDICKLPKIPKYTQYILKERSKNLSTIIIFRIPPEIAYKKNTLWIIKLYKICSGLNINYLVIPMHENTVPEYNLFIQKLNAILSSCFNSPTSILLENTDASIPQLSYIIENVIIKDKINLLINTDLFPSAYTLQIFMGDIIKFSLKDKIKAINVSSEYDKDYILKNFLNANILKVDLH